MMSVSRLIAIGLILVAVQAALVAQAAPGWVWISQAGGPAGACYGTNVCADAAGHVFLTGSYTGTVSFGSTSLVSNGGLDIFVAGLDQNGNWLWARRAGGTFDDSGYGLCLDAAGHCYVTGYFAQTADFGDNFLTSSGGPDVFVAKLDTNGNWIWVRRAGGTSYDRGFGIILAAPGNLALAGVFETNAGFGSTALGSSGGADVFVAGMDTGGNWLWAVRGGGPENDYAYGIAAGGGGSSLAAGFFSDTSDFGSHSLSCQGANDAWVAKVSSSGNFLWARQAGGSSSDYAFGIGSDPGGNAYVTGCFILSAGFGPYTLVSSGAREIFVAKLDGEGEWLWASRAGGAGDDYGYGISAGSDGTCTATGSFRNTASFGALTVTSYGSNDIYAARIDAAGNWLWALGAGGASPDEGRAVFQVDTGSCFVCGNFGGTAHFGSHDLTSGGYKDAFAFLLSPDVEAGEELAPPDSGLTSLDPARPNPFRQGQTALINVHIASREGGTLTIYNFRGQAIQSHRLSSGTHQISISGDGLPSGVYLYQLQTPGLCRTGKLVLLR